ncbi:MAG: site-specific integrase [Parachlamydia sp.]|nr:site-specific integrase [Parachlamydia sp.]
MATIQKRTRADGTDTYRVRIRPPGMPLVSKTLLSFEEAKKWAKLRESELLISAHLPKDFGKEKTFADMVDRYIAKELPKKPKSVAKQTQQLLWWKKQLGKYFLCHITAAMIAEIRDDKLLAETTYRKGLRSSSTANRYLAALSHVYTTAIKEWGWLKDNPVSNVKRPKEGKARERYLDKKEIARLLAECRNSQSPYLYIVVLFALATGARSGEILGLKWNDVDFVRSTATFRDTKNGETRIVSLDPVVVDCLKSQKSKRIISSNYIFPSRDGQSPAGIRTAWDKIIKKFGWKGEVVFHTLRHTAASHLAMRGESQLVISAILGHKTLTMVKRYSHLSLSTTSQALHSMNQEILGNLTYG